MKLKTVIMLVALAGIFVALAYYSNQKKKTHAAPSAIGGKVLPNLAINRVAKLVIMSKDGTTTVAKDRDKWVVASRFNYPAKFEKIVDTIRELSELKIGQTVNAPPSRLASFNLLPPQPGTNKSAQTGALLELRDDKDGLLASLLIGKEFKRPPDKAAPEMMFNFGGYSDGQYVRTVDGKVYLVSKNLERMTEETKTWLADDFINVPANDIKEIEVTGPERAAIKLARARDNEPFELADLQKNEGTLDSSKVNQMTGALSYFGFDDAADPALSLKETGLDRPIVFKVETKEGLIYTLHVGNSLPNDSFDRYLTVSVNNDPSIVTQSVETEKGKEQSIQEPKKNISEQAASLNERFAPWIYIIKSYRAEPISLKRDDLIKRPEPPKTDEAQTNVPSVIKQPE